MAKTKRRFLSSPKAKLRDENISEAEAVTIQKDAHFRSSHIKHNTYTAPYLELSAQLLAEEDQIFKAAANHLASIAKVRRKYAPAIRAIFAEIIANRKLSSEKLDYLTRKLDDI